MTRRIPPRRIGHPEKGTPEYLGDSYRAQHRAKATGCRWVDHNFLKTADDVIVSTHWRRILRHGFVDPTGNYHPDTLVSDIPWHDLRKFRTANGAPHYRVRRADDLIPHGLALGLGIEFDAKQTFTVEDYLQIRELDTTRSRRRDDPGRVQVKTMLDRPGRPWVTLVNASTADLTTIGLCHRKGIHVPESAHSSVDYFRGYRIVWF